MRLLRESYGRWCITSICSSSSFEFLWPVNHFFEVLEGFCQDSFSSYEPSKIGFFLIKLGAFHEFWFLLRFSEVLFCFPRFIKDILGGFFSAYTFDVLCSTFFLNRIFQWFGKESLEIMSDSVDVLQGCVWTH